MNVREVPEKFESPELQADIFQKFAGHLQEVHQWHRNNGTDFDKLVKNIRSIEVNRCVDREGY